MISRDEVQERVDRIRVLCNNGQMDAALCEYADLNLLVRRTVLGLLRIVESVSDLVDKDYYKQQ